MKIKSPYKDYYDYIAHQYGGGDPRMVYVRSKITALDGVTEDDLEYKPKQNGSYYYLHTPECGYVFKWCVVCGIQYLIAAPSESDYHDRYGSSLNLPEKITEYTVIKDGHPAIEALEKKEKEKKRRYFFFRNKRVLDRHEKSHPDLDNLSRLLKSPVFTINIGAHNKLGIMIDDNIPNLKSLGFDKLISSEQMYQNISMYVGNVIPENPDGDPPKSINNEERIITHGFDLKTSFRTRKKEEK